MNKSLMRQILLIIISISILFFSFLGLMYTVNKINDNSSKNNIKTVTESSLEFKNNDEILLKMNENEIENKVVVINPQVSLLAKTNVNRTSNYNIYLNVSENELTYSDQVNKSPEILIKITSPEGKEIKEIVGLNYLEIDGISGFDATEFNGAIKIVNNYAITNNSKTNPTIQNWSFEFILKKLQINQEKNINKNFKAKLSLDKTN